MAADTWGISGPTFVLLYVLCGVVALIFAGLARAALRGWPDLGRRPRPGAEEVAFITGGERQALYAAQAALRVGGSITSVPGGGLQVVGPAPMGASELAFAVFQAAGQGVRQKALLTDDRVGQALERVRARLVRDGWLPGRGRTALMRLAVAPAWALVVLGMARIFAGIANGRPVIFVIVATAVLALLALTFAKVPTRTRAADHMVRGMRIQNSHLSPHRNPSMAMYGAAGAALAVGLFGTAALWAADPAFAAEAEVERQSASSGSSGGDGGSSGGDSGSSGGDGGGGGGCGGGGCGG